MRLIIGFFLLFSFGVLSGQNTGSAVEITKDIELYFFDDEGSENEELLVEKALTKARVLSNTGKHLEALQYYFYALFYSKEHQHCTIDLEIAQFLARWKMYKKALVYLKNTSPTCSAGNPEYNLLLGMCFQKTNNPDSALLYYNYVLVDSLSSTKQLDHAFFGMIEVELLLGNYVNAQDQLVFGLAGYPELKNTVTYQNYLGYTYELLGKYPEAYNSFSAALLLNKSQGGLEQEALIHTRIGLLHELNNLPDSALIQLNKALMIQKNLNEYAEIINTYNYVSKIYLENNKLYLASSYADSAESMIQKKSIHSADQNTYRLQKEIGELKGQKKKVQLYRFKLDSVLHSQSAQKARDSLDFQNRIRQIDLFEKNYIDILQRQHRQSMQIKNLKLQHIEQNRVLQIEKHTKELHEKELELAIAKLADERKGYLITELIAKEKINELRIEEEETQERMRKEQIVSLEKDKRLIANDLALKELELKIQDRKLENEQQSRLLILAGVVLVFIFSFLIFYRWRTQQKNQQIELERQAIDTESKLFRSQMNPHFLFNALNSIKFFILDNHTVEAARYLSKFASLMRHLLSNSEKPFITLYSELEVLMEYMDLEKLRFQNKFDYNIELDESLEIENTYIPPMLLQPIIENAIIHGLSKRNTTGLLVLKFTEKDDQLICVIEDNGVGRQPVNVKSSGEKKHKSMSTNLILRHLNNLKKSEHQMSVTMTTEDLVDDIGLTTGTRVTFTLPLLEQAPTML